MPSQTESPAQSPEPPVDGPSAPALVDLDGFEPADGYCYRVRLPPHFPAGDTAAAPDGSALILFQDGVRLGPAHSPHIEICGRGNGRYSHWHDTLYLSARDNSDPRANGSRFQAFHPLVGSDGMSPRAHAIAELARLPDDLPPTAAFAAIENALRRSYPNPVVEIASPPMQRELFYRATLDYRMTLAGLRANDVAFLSIMKSGRTWVRFFLQQYIGTMTHTPISLAEPAIPRLGPYPSIYFYHGFFSVFLTIPGTPVGLFDDAMIDRPLVHLTRDPRDIVVSWYYYLRKRDPETLARWAPSRSFDEFLLSPVLGIERIARAQELDHELFARHPGPKLRLTYEAIRTSTKDEFTKLLRFLSPAPIESAAVLAALANSEFTQMQALDIAASRSGGTLRYGRLGVDDWSGDINELNVRSGEVGGFAQLRPGLCDDTILRQDFPITARLLGKV